MSAGDRVDSAARSARPRGGTWLRPAAIVVHRWVGLTIATFLIIAGMTGCVIAFFADLDEALNPALFRVEPPTPDAPLLDAITLREILQSHLPPGEKVGAILEIRPHRTVNYWIDGRETFVDPYTGRIVGARTFGAISEGRKNVFTFIYRLHYSLALGRVGTIVFGIAALLWTVDCFVGAYLTFPPHRRRGAARRSPWAWVRRWAPAWLLSTKRLFVLIFTWHRASGLWLWGVLLVFAWSGVALNLGDEIYRPVMNRVLPAPPSPALPIPTPPRGAPKLNLRAARDRGRQHVAAEAARRGFRVLGERWLDYDDKHGTYSYTVESTHDVDKRLPDTVAVFDGDDGRLLTFQTATGQNARGTVDSWLIALHFGAVRQLGLVYRVFVSIFGAAVAVLSATGVWIWWRKRRRAG